MAQVTELKCDILIIGSGAAGLSLALHLAQTSNVLLISKDTVTEGATLHAQGGIAAVFDETDSVESHIADTLVAGAGMCDRDAVEFVASNARHCVQWLIDQGVTFDTTIQNNGESRYHLTREGGHSHRRILHSADATGQTVETTLVSQALNHPNIRIMERYSAVDLILSDQTGMAGARRVVGAWLWNSTSERVETCQAKAVALATGGASNVYLYTTNPHVATGDGVAMAWRAGCRVANLEFNQFHPTVLYHPQARNFLLTEALRGEGALLRRPDGSRFMPAVHEKAELAPRDIVARAMNHEMQRPGVDCLYLDISHKPPAFIRQHFPTIYKKLLSLGIDLTTDPVPVVPAAHYTCGGVMVDKHGRTDIDGLYAIGEVSCTGLHGANRMASNSLLECLVYGWSAATNLKQWLSKVTATEKLPQWDEKRYDSPEERAVIQHYRQELQLLMWNDVGIVRTTTRLKHAQQRITLLQQKIAEFYPHFRISNSLLELRNLVQVAELIVRCALTRQESRGLHYTLDYPTPAESYGPSILLPDNYIKR